MSQSILFNVSALLFAAIAAGVSIAALLAEDLKTRPSLRFGIFVSFATLTVFAAYIGLKGFDSSPGPATTLPPDAQIMPAAAATDGTLAVPEPLLSAENANTMLAAEQATPTEPLLTDSGTQTSGDDAACQLIKGKLPDDPQMVSATFGIPADKSIRLFYELCQDAPNGFIVDDSPSLVTLTVPEGGCIDSYSGAQFSDPTVPEYLFGGRRAYSGSVTTTSLTYRIAGCEQKP